MAPRIISLNLHSLVGKSWSTISAEDVDRLEMTLRELPKRGSEPSQYTVTGVRRYGDVIGGFFVVQYLREGLEYDDQKREQRTTHLEWEKTVFTFFPRVGAVLLQSRQYPKGITESRVRSLFERAVPEIMRDAKIGNLITVTPLRQRRVSDRRFVQVFDDPSNRVEKVVVRDLQPNPDLTGLTYYNPQRERNEIIGQSHAHDFGLLDRISMDANEKNPDLRQVHIAKSAVRSGTNEEMRYFDTQGQRHILRRTIRENYEITVDEDVDTIREEDIRRIANQVLEQYGLSRPEEGEVEPERPPTLFDLDTLE